MFHHPRLPRLMALLVATAPLMAQGVSTQLSGRVLDTQSHPISGALVTLRSTETGFVRTVSTDANGSYILPLLPVGAYHVGASKSGYQTATNIRVNLDLGTAAPVVIRLAPVAESTVEVAATITTLDTDRATAATIVSPDALAELPVFNRSFTSLATLTPQVTVDSSRGNLAIGGQRGINTSINIDGGDNNEPFFGGALGAAEGKTPFTISIEAIREYQVVTDGASAEFGRMGGGYVNAITKSGTNDFGGSLFYYTRPQSMVARQPNLNGVPDSNKVDDFTQNQFGFSAGGPILKDKLFYFAAYDGQRKTTPVNLTWGGANPVSLDPTKAADAALVGRSQGYDYHENSDTVFLRFDYLPSTDHSLQFRLNQSKFNGDAYYGQTSAYENTLSDVVKTTSLVGQWNWNLSANWFNEARFTYAKDEMPRTTRTNIPEVSISNVGYYGANPYPRDYSTKRTQIQDAVSYVTPTLQIKAGIDYNRISVSEIFSSNYQGVYYFQDTGSGASKVSAFGNFEAGNWYRYNQRFSLMPGVDSWQAGSFDANEKQVAAFVQADLQLADNVKLGLGLRWDQQVHPDFPIADFSNPAASTMPLTATIPNSSELSPRLSLIWTPDMEDGHSVVRFNAGRYVSTTPAVFLYQAYTVNGVRMASVDFYAADATTYGIPRGASFDPNNPYRLPSFPSGKTAPVSDIFTFSPDFKNPYTDRANLGFERAFTSGWVLGVSTTYAKGGHLERLVDLNLGTPTANTFGRLVFPTTATGGISRPNTSFARLAEYVSDASSLYHAYTLSAKYQKEDSPFSAQFYYTWSIDKDNDSNERNFSGYSQANTQRLGDEWSYSDRDRPEVFTGYFTFNDRQWSGIVFGTAIRYMSGTPYSLTYGSDLNKDGASNDRVYLNGVDSGRNSQRSASTTSVDLKLSRDFQLHRTVKLGLSMEVFNLLNRHDTWVKTTPTGAADQATPSYLYSNQVNGAARQVQVGARLAF